MARHQHVVQVSVAAVQSDVPDVPHHDVLHTNVVLSKKDNETQSIIIIIIIDVFF